MWGEVNFQYTRPGKTAQEQLDNSEPKRDNYSGYEVMKARNIVGIGITVAALLVNGADERPDSVGDMGRLDVSIDGEVVPCDLVTGGKLSWYLPGVYRGSSDGLCGERLYLFPDRVALLVFSSDRLTPVVVDKGTWKIEGADVRIRLDGRGLQGGMAGAIADYGVFSEARLYMGSYHNQFLVVLVSNENVRPEVTQFIERIDHFLDWENIRERLLRESENASGLRRELQERQNR
jgi:hypothetical protein